MESYQEYKAKRKLQKEQREASERAWRNSLDLNTKTYFGSKPINYKEPKKPRRFSNSKYST